MNGGQAGLVPRSSIVSFVCAVFVSLPESPVPSSSSSLVVTMQNFIILASLFVQGVLPAEDHWTYSGAAGPSHWSSKFFTCTGSRQSPINIESANVKGKYWKPFMFKSYDEIPTRMRIQNNGHTAQVEIDASRAPRISSAGLKGEYIFAQLHFHWGKQSGQGSEHTIDGVRYPMEMHLVHYKASYGTITESVKHPDGLAVLGIFFVVSENDNPVYTPLVSALAKIKSATSHTQVPASYPLEAFLPKDKNSFYRYDGSLTTPTCNEIVIWTVFQDPVPISENQLSAFRNLLDEDKEALVDNFRPPQQLRSRRVYSNVAGSGADSTSMKKLGLALYFMSTMAVLMMNM